MHVQIWGHTTMASRYMQLSKVPFSIDHACSPENKRLLQNEIVLFFPGFFVIWFAVKLASE